MTDPVSIFSIVSGSASLAAQLGKVINDLYVLSQRYRFAELTISSMSSSLETVQWSWSRIAKILEGWTRDEVVGQDEASELFTQLDRSLKAGFLVISALEEDLNPYRDMPERRASSIMRRAKVVWNEQAFKGHQDRIRDQVNSMNLLINVMHMPEPAVRKQALDDGQTVFQKSDESAYSIVPSRASRSERDDESLFSSKSETSLVYRELVIDNDLFTARVYKRNYRNTLIRGLLQIGKLSPAKRKESPNSDHINPAENEKEAYLNPEQWGSRARSTCSSVSFLDKEFLRLTCKEAGVHPLWVQPEWQFFTRNSYTPRVQGPRLPRFLIESFFPLQNTEGVFEMQVAMEKPEFFPRLFREGYDFPAEWLGHCLMTACLKRTEYIGLLVLEHQIIELSIIRKEVGPLYPYYDPVQMAYHFGQMGIVEELLHLPESMKHCRHLRPQLVRTFIRWPHAEMVAVLIKQDFDINFQYEQGKHALHIASELRSWSCFEILVNAGANVDAKDDYGRTARDNIKRLYPNIICGSEITPLVRRVWSEEKWSYFT